jgi:hypothetical protein
MRCIRAPSRAMSASARAIRALGRVAAEKLAQIVTF